jgi:hypothetical protein
MAQYAVTAIVVRLKSKSKINSRKNEKSREGKHKRDNQGALLKLKCAASGF